jgi:hypothetical protein
VQDQRELVEHERSAHPHQQAGEDRPGRVGVGGYRGERPGDQQQDARNGVMHVQPGRRQVVLERAAIGPDHPGDDAGGEERDDERGEAHEQRKPSAVDDVPLPPRRHRPIVRSRMPATPVELGASPSEVFQR